MKRRWIAGRGGGGGGRRREQRAMKEIMVENFMESPASGNCRVCTAGKDVEILKGGGEGGGRGGGWRLMPSREKLSEGAAMTALNRASLTPCALYETR